MTDDVDERLENIEERLAELESRLDTQGQMLVGEDKLREEFDALKRNIGQLGFVDLDTEGGD